jgi:chromosome segregation ATPase
MSDIIEELLESFRNSSQKLEGLSEGLEELQKAQTLVENLSSNLSEAATALKGTATSHDNFITSAQTTNAQLGEVITVLEGLDTKSINATLAQIVRRLKQNEGMLDNLATTIAEAEAKASATDTKLDHITRQLEAVIAANTSLSEQLSKAQKAIIDLTDEAASTASGRYKQIMFAVVLILSASGGLVANLFGMLNF